MGAVKETQRYTGWGGAGTSRCDLPALLAASLDAPEVLLPHLPELLSDLEEFGARAEDVVHLLQQHGLPAGGRVLDLGCGKGAAAIAIADRFEVSVLGIDGIPAFVAHARGAARHAGLADRCRFEVGDVRDAVRRERGYDVVMMLALGELLGSLATTVMTLSECASPGGYVVIDDAYLTDVSLVDEDAELYDHDGAVAALATAGLEVVGEVATDTDAAREWLHQATASLSERAAALALRRPELAVPLRQFAARQVEETQASSPLAGVIWLLRRPR